MCYITDHVSHCLVTINIVFHETLVTPVTVLCVFALDLILMWWHVGPLHLWGADSGTSPSTED